MEKPAALIQSVEEIIVPQQRQLPPGVSVAFVLCVWNAVVQDARPVDRIADRWQGNDLDLESRLHRDLYLRTAELIGSECGNEN